MPLLSVARPLLVALLLLILPEAFAHGVAGGDRGFIEQSSGALPGPFVYLGAKHMVTGYDHLLFLAGVIFFLYRLREVGLYVSLFAIGHSITLLAGVLGGFSLNPYLVDAVIGFSVLYKALDNLGCLQRWLGFAPDTRAAVLVFGLIHGCGLASKLLEFELNQSGLVSNLIAFNIGVELGQLLALGAILIFMGWWRRSPAFARQAIGANRLLGAAGIGLMGWQLAGFLSS